MLWKGKVGHGKFLDYQIDESSFKAPIYLCALTHRIGQHLIPTQGIWSQATF